MYLTEFSKTVLNNPFFTFSLNHSLTVITGLQRHHSLVNQFTDFRNGLLTSAIDFNDLRDFWKSFLRQVLHSSTVLRRNESPVDFFSHIFNVILSLLLSFVKKRTDDNDSAVRCSLLQITNTREKKAVYKEQFTTSSL